MKTMKPKKVNPFNPNTEQAYADVAKLLYKEAWRTALKYNIPYDECLSECHFAFVKALNWRYDPTKGTKFSSQVCTIAKWRLRSLVRNRTLAEPTLELNEETTAVLAPTQYSPCLEAVADLSEDAREIISLLLETPAELMEISEVRTPKQLLARVRDYLLGRGTTQGAFNKANEEIRLRFSEVWA